MKGAVWFPSDEYKASTRLYQWMNQLGFTEYEQLYQKSIEDVAWLWGEAERFIDFQWRKPYKKVLDIKNGIAFPKWYVDGTCNIIDSVLGRWIRSDTKNKTALIWEGENGAQRSFTYQELNEWVGTIAAGLKKQGVNKGDRITVYMPMIPETAVVMLAAMKIGAIASPIFSGFSADAVAVRVQSAEAKVIVTTDGCIRRGKVVSLKQEVDRACEQCPTVEKVIVVDYIGHTVSLQHRDVAWEQLEQAEEIEEAVEMKSDDPLMLLYTSGTTGKPKGTVHTHAGFPIKAVFDAAIGMNIQAGDRLMWVTDMGWMMGPFLLFSALMNGAAMVMYDGTVDAPAPDRLWELVDSHQITHLGISPTLIRSLMAKGDEWVEKHSLASLQIIGSTGEPWNRAPWLWLFHTVGKGKLPIFNYSGGTEISGGIVANVLVRPIAPITFNAALPGMAVAAVDEQGKEVLEKTGELCLEQPWVGMTKGFWNDDARYINTYWAAYEKKWLHGDWITYTGEQYMITGRSDDTLNVAGKRIGPAEYESVLVQHAAVVEAAAIGIPDEKKGEVGCCFVVLREGFSYSKELKEELLSLIRTHIGKAFSPKEIYCIADLPKTRNAKIMRRVIKAAFLKQPLGDISALINPEVIPHIEALSVRK